MHPRARIITEYRLELADALVVVIIARAAYPGQAEAGWICVSHIQRAVAIR